MSLILSLASQSSSQPETLAHSLQNGQKLPPMTAKTSTAVPKQQEPTAVSNKPSRPAGDRRCVSVCQMSSDQVQTVQSFSNVTSICLVCITRQMNIKSEGFGPVSSHYNRESIFQYDC